MRPKTARSFVFHDYSLSSLASSVWLNTCVGAHNYALFMVFVGLFLSFFVFQIVVSLVLAVAAVASTSNAVNLALAASSAAPSPVVFATLLIVVAVPQALAACALLSLFVFHLYLVATSQSTVGFLQARGAQHASELEGAELKRLQSMQGKLDRDRDEVRAQWLRDRERKRAAALRAITGAASRDHDDDDENDMDAAQSSSERVEMRTDRTPGFDEGVELTMLPSARPSQRVPTPLVASGDSNDDRLAAEHVEIAVAQSSDRGHDRSIRPTDGEYNTLRVDEEGDGDGNGEKATAAAPRESECDSTSTHSSRSAASQQSAHLPPRVHGSGGPRSRSQQHANLDSARSATSVSSASQSSQSSLAISAAAVAASAAGAAMPITHGFSAAHRDSGTSGGDSGSGSSEARLSHRSTSDSPSSNSAFSVGLSARSLHSVNSSVSHSPMLAPQLPFLALEGQAQVEADADDEHAAFGGDRASDQTSLRHAGGAAAV